MADLIIERDKFYVTRHGKRAKCLTTEYPSVFSCLMLLGNGATHRVRADGGSLAEADPLDIVGPWVEPVKPMEYWENVYPFGARTQYPTQAEAIDAADNSAVRVAVHMREVLP